MYLNMVSAASSLFEIVAPSLFRHHVVGKVAQSSVQLPRSLVFQDRFWTDGLLISHLIILYPYLQHGIGNPQYLTFRHTKLLVHLVHQGEAFGGLLVDAIATSAS